MFAHTFMCYMPQSWDISKTMFGGFSTLFTEWQQEWCHPANASASSYSCRGRKGLWTRYWSVYYHYTIMGYVVFNLDLLRSRILLTHVPHLEETKTLSFTSSQILRHHDTGDRWRNDSVANHWNCAHLRGHIYVFNMVSRPIWGNISNNHASFQICVQHWLHIHRRKESYRDGYSYGCQVESCVQSTVPWVF